MDLRQERTSNRISFKRSMRFSMMGDKAHSPDKTAIDGVILDWSDTGMKIKGGGRLLHDGVVIVVRVPIEETRTTVPTIAQVRWVKPAETGSYEAGLMFMM